MGFSDSIYNDIKRNPNYLQDHLKNHVKVEYVKPKMILRSTRVDESW